MLSLWGFFSLTFPFLFFVLCFSQTMESPKYELVIEAKDMGGMDVGLTGTATATILIDDKNDHAPEFTKKEVRAAHLFSTEQCK